MYDSIGLSKFLRVLLYVNAVIVVALATDFFGLLPDLPMLSAASISVLSVSALLFLFGQTPIFPWLCNLPGLWQFFPNIDGVYEVEISSNWSVIKARSEGREPEITVDGQAELYQRLGRMTITARLMHVDVHLKMDDSYLTSESIDCSLHKKRGAQHTTLFYLFKSTVTVPKSTDSSSHFGAARVRIPLERQPRVLEGNYWTDRNWHNGLNTAGRIRLRRV